MQRHLRRGIALLEVMIAMTVLTVAALSLTAWAREMAAAEAIALNRDSTLNAASAYLDRLALWPREDLDRHFGTHREGNWSVRVERTGPHIYEIGLASDTGSELLLTRVYRPQPPDTVQ